MKKVFVVTAALALLCLGSLAQADVFNLGAGLKNLETVTVGDAGNASDPRVTYRDFGAVSYSYRIGKFEVTSAQYVQFLNAVASTDTYGLYNTKMSDPVSSWGCNIQRSGSAGTYTYGVASDWANRPVNYVSYWDACRFANWLDNGQPTGLQNKATTEDGAYTLNGFNSSGGWNIHRNAGAEWFIPDQDEWYKAAYYNGGGTNAGYWDYATQSDSVPTNRISNPYSTNSATYYYYNDIGVGSPYYRSNVGEHQNSVSAYGTYDQSGNVRELTADPGTNPWAVGGCFNYSSDYMRSSSVYSRYQEYPTTERESTGFRIAAAVPEPSSILALLCGLGGMGSIRLLRRRR